MKIKLFMAMSLNGMIAEKNGSEDFLSDKNWDSFNDLLKKSKCLIYGRNTYERVMGWDEKYLDKLKDKILIIVSKNKKFSIRDKPKHFLINSPKEAIVLGKKFGLKEMILAGGGKLNSSFLKENLIDEIILNIEPAILGKGIKLFNDLNNNYNLSFVKVNKINRNIVQLHYKVFKNRIV